jgi:DNA-binding SARP family transcriptional activator
MGMRFRILGPLRVWNGTAWSDIRAAQQRVVLAVLLIDAGRTVSAQRLIDELWGERPPRAASSVLRGYVLRLRRLLGGGPRGPLTTRAGGYELVIEDDDLDARVFERLVAAGRRALAEGDLDAAEARLSRALGLWRGAALADVLESPTVALWTAQQEQVRLTVVEERLGVLLELGRPAEVVDQAHRLVAEEPLRERLWAQLMLALFRGGRRAEALKAYQRARRVLIEELGLEPGPELQELQRAILADR